MSGGPRRLDVHLYGQLAGQIERLGGTLTFRYDDAYLASPHPTPLSLSMPLSTAVYTNKWVGAYLRGLLPDNEEVRRRWARHFGLRDRDTFGLIAQVGSDAAGGALILPEGLGPADLSSHVDPVSEADIAARLRRLRADETGWLGEEEHWSLAGVQSKFTLRKTASGWGIAHGAEPSTHIVKPGIGRILDQALIEHVSMTAAAAVGSRTAPTSYVEFEDQPAIVVERFDRVVRGGRLVRVHQEDFCQTFALDPARKYEADRGPGVQMIADRLRGAASLADVEEFVRAVIVNYLLGAPDAHAKNYALLLVGASARLAPLYDVASGLTADREGRLRYPRTAMSIGGERVFGEVRGRDWDRFAARAGLPDEQVRGWVREFAVQLPDAVDDSAAQLGPSATPQVRLLGARVRHLAKTTLATLSEGPGARRGRKPKEAGARSLAEVALSE